MHGYGIYMYKNGDRYEGNWVNGLKEGAGQETYGNGIRSYIGFFKDGKYNGSGQLKESDGSLYRGEFKDGLKDGQGNLISEPFEYNQ